MKKIELCLLMVVCFLGANGQEEISKIENAHAGQVLSIALTSDASRILTGGSDGKSHIWDLKAGTKWKSFSGQAAGVAFNSSNKIFVTGGSDKRMIVWDAELGKPKKILKCESEITCVAFNPVNDNIACGYVDGKATIWNAETGSLTATMEGHKQSINGLCFSPDGKQLVTGSSDNTVKFWDVSNGKLTNTVDPGVKGITDIQYSPDGKFVAGGSENNAVFFLDAGSGNLIADHTEHKGKVNAVAFSPDVQFLASGGDDGKIIIWDVQTRQTVKNFEAHAGGLTDLVIGDRGLVLVSAGNDGDIRVWDIEGLNIGKKKFTIGVQKPKLICSSLDLDDKNGNGIIEFDDKASLGFSIWNEGKGVAYDVVVEIISTGVNGLTFDKEFFLGNLSGDKKQNVKIPLYISHEMETSSGTFTVKIKEANSFNPDPITLAFQTKGGEAYTYIMVTDYKYSSGTGKAEQGAPITLKLKLQNTSTQTAKDLKISYGFPNEVMAADKLSESIPVLQPGEMKEVSVEFYATEKFTGSKLDVKVNIEGAKYSNLKDIDLAITMNEKLPVSNLAIAQADPGDQPIYRGGGDPLKGLNISRAQTMQAGKYYALIIGIDKYSGTWPP